MRLKQKVLKLILPHTFLVLVTVRLGHGPTEYCTP